MNWARAQLEMYQIILGFCNCRIIKKLNKSFYRICFAQISMAWLCTIAAVYMLVTVTEF